MRSALVVLFAALLSGCGLLGTDELSPCAPVDVGGECFAPSEEAFIEHALTSAGAWPQLKGVKLSADRIIEGADLANNIETWIVPMLSDGRMVAVSRFVPVENGQVKLGEVALLEEPLPRLPDDLGGEFVLFIDVGCIDDASAGCLFGEYRWAVRLADGRFQLPDGSVVDEVPARPG